MTQDSEIAANILIRAVDLETKGRLTESIVCYQEGIEILLNMMRKKLNEEEKKGLRKKIEEYMSRAEKLKMRIDTEKKLGSYHEQIIVEENSCGHSYERMFGRFLDENVTKIEVDDSYVRLYHQCQNFLRLCELAVKNCYNLKEIILTTGDHNADQKNWLEMLREDLALRYKINLIIHYSSTLHDREIRLDSGWIIKSGRGLDYFKGADSKFSIGYNNMDLRKCHKTTIDIFHKKDMRKTYG